MKPANDDARSLNAAELVLPSYLVAVVAQPHAKRNPLLTNYAGLLLGVEFKLISDVEALHC